MKIPFTDPPTPLTQEIPLQIASLLSVSSATFPQILEEKAKDLFPKDAENQGHYIIIFNELDEQLSRKPQGEALERVLKLILTAFKSCEKSIKIFNSLELLLDLVVKCDEINNLCLAFEVISKVLSEENSEFFKKHKQDILRLAYIGKFVFLHINSHYHGSKARLYDFFAKDIGFKNLMNNLKEHEREIFDIEQFHQDFLFEYSFPNKETILYQELLKNNNTQQEFIKQEYKKLHHKNNLSKSSIDLISEMIEENHLNIKEGTPLWDALLIRIKFDRFLKTNIPRKHILELIMKASCVNIAFHKIIHSCFPEIAEAFSLTLSSNYELFTYLKNLMNLFFLDLDSETHVLILSTIQILINKAYYKQPKAFMATVFSYKEVFQRIMKVCSSLRVDETHEKKVKSNGSLFSDNIACYSKFLEDLMYLLKTRMKDFFTNEESQINIYALSSLISSFANIMSTNIESSGLMPYTFKTLKYVTEIFSMLMPKQEYIRDFNLIDILRTRLENDLYFLAKYDKDLSVYKNAQWTVVKLEKLIKFDASLIKTITSAFQHIESNAHHNLAALARKIADSPFLNLLQELLKIKKNDERFQGLAVETIILLGDICQESPNLISKLINNEIIELLIIWISSVKKLKRTKFFWKLMNFISATCMNVKGMELEKKYDLISKNLSFIINKDFLEIISEDVNHNKNNCMTWLAIETIKLLGIHGYREVIHKAIYNLINSLLTQQREFLNLVEGHFSSKSSNYQKELSDYELLAQMLNNFCEFFCYFVAKSNEKFQKQVDLSFIRLVSFPMLSLMEYESHTKVIKCLRYFASKAKNERNGIRTEIIAEISRELASLEKKTGTFSNLSDLSKIIHDEMAYIARTKGLKVILEEHSDQKQYVESLRLLGSITYVENLLDFAMCSQTLAHSPDNFTQIYSKITPFFHVILRQLNREDLYYMNSLIKTDNMSENTEKSSELYTPAQQKALETIRNSMNFNRLNFHENIKSFLTFPFSPKDLSQKKNFGSFHESLASLFTNMLATLPKNLAFDKINSPLELLSSNNTLIIFYEILRDILKDSPSQIYKADFTIKLFEEAVFTSFFRFLDGFLDFLSKLPVLTASFHDKLLEEIINLVLKNLNKLIKILIFIPNDLNIEVLINNAYEKNDSLRPFLNFIEIEILNAFAICLKHFQNPNKSAFLCKPLQEFFETAIEKLKSLTNLKHSSLISTAEPLKAPKKRSFYQNYYGYEDSLESPEWLKITEDCVKNLNSMGFSKEVAELAISNLEYPSTEAATEWILSHPEEVKKAEEEAIKERSIRLSEEEEAKRKEKLSNAAKTLVKPALGNLGKKQMNAFPEKEYKEELLLILWSLGKHFMKRLLKMKGCERIIWDFLMHLLQTENPLSQKLLTLELYRSLAENIKENTHQMSQKLSLKLGIKKMLSVLQEKEEKKSSYFEEKLEVASDLAEFFSILDTSFSFLLRVVAIKENVDFKKKLLREHNALEALRFLEKSIDSFGEKGISGETLTNFQSLATRLLVFVHEIVENNKENLKIESNKSLLSLILGILQHINKYSLSLVVENSVLEGILSLLIQLLENGPALVKFFIEKKGVHELLKLENSGEEIDGCVFGLVYKTFELLIIDQETVECHFEAQIKQFFLEANEKNVELNQFLDKFKQYHKNPMFSNLVKKLCVISKRNEKIPEIFPPILGKEKEKDPNNPKKEEDKNPLQKEKEKLSQNIITLLENIHLKNDPSEKKHDPNEKNPMKKETYFIKLDSNLSFTTLVSFTPCFEETSSTRKLSNPVSPEKKSRMELEEGAKIKTVDFTLKAQQLSIFHSLIESLLMQFSQHIGKNRKKLLVSYPLIMKLLHIFIRKYPLLIPGLIKYNCAKAIKKLGLTNLQDLLAEKLGKVSLKKKETRSVSLLKFFIRIICLFSLERFHPLLLEFCLDNYLLYEQKNKEILPFAAVIRQKILNNIYINLKSEIEGANFLQNKESFKTIFCYSSLHVLLLRVIEFAKLSLKVEEPLFHNFFKLYGDAFKNLTIQSFHNNEPGFLILQTPLSLLYQLFANSLLLKSQAKDLKDKQIQKQLIQGKGLQQDANFFEDWRLIYSNEGNLHEILDINPIKLNGLKLSNPFPVELNHPLDPQEEIEVDSDDEEVNINIGSGLGPQSYSWNRGVYSRIERLAGRQPIGIPNEISGEEGSIEIEEGFEGERAERQNIEIEENNEEEDSGDFYDEDDDDDDDNEEEEGAGIGSHDEQHIESIEGPLQDSIEGPQPHELHEEGHMDIEENENVDDNEEDDEESLLEPIEEEFKLNEPNKILLKNSLFDNNFSIPSVKSFNFQEYENILALETVPCDPELHKTYSSMLKAFTDLENEEVYKELTQQSRVNFSPTTTFFTEWHSLYQKPANKPSEPLFSPLKKESSLRGFEFDHEDRISRLERMLMMNSEEGEDGGRHPIHLLNAIMGEREEREREREDRYRNYFHDMRTHLDILRGYLMHDLGSETNALGERRIEQREIVQDLRGPRHVPQNAGNEDILGDFRQNMLSEFDNRIMEIEEENVNANFNFNNNSNELPANINNNESSNNNNQIQNSNNENVQQPQINDKEGKPELEEEKVQNIESQDNKQISDKKEEPANFEQIISENQEKNTVISQQKNNEVSNNDNLAQNVNENKEQAPNFEPHNVEKPSQNEPILQEVPQEESKEQPQEKERASLINFEDLGLPANFLELNNIDPSYFNSLNEELQMEIILQNLPKDRPQESEPNNNTNNNSNNNNTNTAPVQNPPPEESKAQQNELNPSELLDPEVLAFINELPENLRNEVLQQQLAPFQRQNEPAPQAEIDNATFLASLTADLREEVLLTASPEFLESLPPDIIAEANALRNRAQFRNPYRFWQREPQGLKKKEKKDEKDLLLPPSHALQQTLKDKNVLMKLNSVDEKVLENLLSFLYSDRRLFQKLPLGLMQTLLKSPSIEYKIFDALIFVLLNEKLPALKDTQEKFPYLALYEKNGIMSNYEKVYSEISLRALYLLSRFTAKFSCSYFLEKDEKKRLESLIVLREKQSFFKKKTNNFNEFLSLTGLAIFQKSFMHLDLLITSLFNVTERIRATRSQELDLNIDPDCIGSLCHVLSIDFIDNNVMKKLSHIISVLCLEKKNLDCFIEQLKITISKISEVMNNKLEETLKALRVPAGTVCVKGDESLLMGQVEVNLEGEKKIYNIFKIIKELFEKALALEKNEKKDEKKEEKNEKNDKIEKKSEEEEEKKEEKKEPKSISHVLTKKEVLESFQMLIMNESSNNLWINVTELLMIMNENFPHTVTFLNPIIHKLISILEGFFLIYSFMRNDSALNKQIGKMSYISHFEETLENEMVLEKTISNFRNTKITIDEMFVLLCEKNKKILNMMIRQNYKLLSESMNIIVTKMPKILEFDIKKNYFRRNLKKLKEERDDRYYHSNRLRIRRNNLFLDSYNQLKKFTKEELRQRITIEFVGEEGIDQGGLTREWYSLISREMFNENYALFMRSLNGVTFQPDPRSKVNPDHLDYFKFAGRVIGKALHDGYMADAYFTRAFYKHILGKPLNIYDMEDIDPQYFKNLKWILENDIKDLEFTFSIERDNFGKLEVHDLIENGRNIMVTNENKKLYVEKVCYAKMAQDIKDQIESFLRGFNELIPRDLISVFDSMELELMISGLPDIDIQDLKENTDYKQYNKDSQVIKWLWEILETLDKSEKAGFIQFVTGTSKVPIEGFKALRGMNGPTKFSINKTYDSTKLPTSHTCFNQLDLPEYPSKEILREKLLITIREGKEGFGFL